MERIVSNIDVLDMNKQAQKEMVSSMLLTIEHFRVFNKMGKMDYPKNSVYICNNYLCQI